MKPTRINFDNINLSQIERILRGADLSVLDPDERAYFDLMEMVRGLRARTLMPGGSKVVTKAGIIKLLKSEKYGLSDWMARQVYNDSLNFFYSECGVTVQAWKNLYAEKLDKLADLAAATGRLKEARGFLKDAATMRGCFEPQRQEIPDELLAPKNLVIYTTDAESMGAARADRKELEMFIDSVPDIPQPHRERLKEDAGIKQRNLLSRMIEDVKEFGEAEE